MPYDPNARKAMRLGPSYKYQDQLDMGYDDPPSSYIIPPSETNTGPIDDRTRLMLEALDHFGSQSRMPQLDPSIHPPDPEGRLPMERDIGELDQERSQDDIYDLMVERRDLYPKGDRIREVYNPGMAPDDAQEMMKEMLEEYLKETGRQ